MNRNKQIDQSILRTLKNYLDEPMPESAVFNTVRLDVRPRPTDLELTAARDRLQANGDLHGLPNAEAENEWLLTVKGKIRANQL